jgi:hypothetical protein
MKQCLSDRLSKFILEWRNWESSLAACHRFAASINSAITKPLRNHFGNPKAMLLIGTGSQHEIFNT